MPRVENGAQAVNKRRRKKTHRRYAEVIVDAKTAHAQMAVPLHALTTGDIRTLAELATNLWRAKQRIVGTRTEADVSPELKKVLRPILAALENLDKLGVRIADFTGEPFVQGMALNVISSQPNSSLSSDRICETLKPTIFFKEQFVQAGDVIIEGPPSQSEKENKP